MENTYWNHKGTHQALADKLSMLVAETVPLGCSIKCSKNKALERFRKASNAYYDIFNNGGGSTTEPKMDEIILAAAKEQGFA